MRRPTSLLLLLLALTFAALASPPVSAQDVVLDDEVVLSERPRGGGNWAAPGAVLPDDQSALASELYSILQSQPPLLPVRVGLPSRSTLDVTAYPTINRRTGLPCVGCRNPCRSFRYTYARPDRGAVTVEGQRCRRRNGQWVAFEPDTVVGQRPAAPGAPMAGTFQGAPRAQPQSQSQAMRRQAPPPLPPTRPGDAGAVAGIAGSDAVPSPFDPPLVDNGPVAGNAGDIPSDDEIGAGGEDVAAGEEIAPRRDVATAQPLPGSADDVWATEPLPELSPAEDQSAADEGDAGADAGGPLVLTPSDEAPADTTSEVAAAGDEPSAGEPVDTAAVPPAATEAPADAAATAPAPAPATPVETQTARVVMPFGGGDQGTAVEVETTADPDVVRMLRMLRYLDPETSAEPTRQAYDAAVSDFASDERFALPQSNSALRERLEGAVDRLAALSSCPASAGDGYGACLQQAR